MHYLKKISLLNCSEISCLENTKKIFKTALLLFLVSISLSAQKLGNRTAFELRGAGKGLSIDKIYLVYEVGDKRIYDSAKIDNNKFILKGNIDYPTRATLCNNREFSMSRSNSTELFLDPAVMEIKLDFYDFSTAEVKGSKTQDEYSQLQKVKNGIYSKRDSISLLIRSYFDRITVASDPQIKLELEHQLEILEKLSDQNKITEMEMDFNFIRQNPSSFIAPSLLYYRLAKKEGLLNYETIISLADGLSKEVKESPSGVRLFKRISDFRNSKVGSIAPDFILKDYNGEVIPLATFRDKKYVLIDFWASWCEPCRDDLPFLKDAYEKYKDKGFEIISISRDKNLNSWRKAIADEKIGLWKHISVAENQTKIEDNYLVTAIPVKILINKRGEIIGRWKGSGDENKMELKKILEKTFDKE
ncbi:thioredoxin-like domain-containing protein [Flavobacterium sp. MMS24-S5]|uniref:thioredoxin-like domain-containing protein n=1 Tax=Flavobacterium sp. MMS24-S5 TaxID=3416605 RepID=UPI003CFDC34A